MKPPPLKPLTINGMAPAFVDKKTAAAYLQSPKLVERMLWATRHTDDPWFVIAANQEGDPKQKTLITTTSVEKAAERMVRGEYPPKIGKLSAFFADSFVGDVMEGVVSRAFPDSYDPDAEEERMVAKKFQEEQAKRQKEALEEERKKFREEAANQGPADEEPIKKVIIEVDL